MRQSRPSARSSNGVSARSRKTIHSSTKRSGNGLFRFSSQTLHCRPASSTASDQLGKRLGGHCSPLGGEKTKRYASVRLRMTFVKANRSAGHSSRSSVNGLPAKAYHVDAGVGSSAWESTANSTVVESVFIILLI